MPTYPFWGQMNPVLANEILLSTQKGNKKLYRTTVECLAPGIGKRIPLVMEMPKLERHAAFAQLLGRPESENLSFNLLSQWLVRDHADLLCGWLDSLGIEHDERGCADAFPDCPPKATLKKAMDDLLEKHDPALVGLYLTTFNEIDEVQWEALSELLDEEPRLNPGREAQPGSPEAAKAELEAETSES